MALYTGPLGLGFGSVRLRVVNWRSPSVSFFSHWLTLGKGVVGKLVEAAPEETPDVRDESVEVVEHELWASSSLSDSTVLTELFLLPPNSSFLFKLAGADWYGEEADPEEDASPDEPELGDHLLFESPEEDPDHLLGLEDSSLSPLLMITEVSLLIIITVVILIFVAAS